MKKPSIKKIAVDGVIAQNPTLKLVLGTCPTLALTTMAMNGIGMGAAVTFVLICSNVLISLLRNVIPNQVRIPAFVLIIATFVTIVRLVMDKLMPDLYASLGLYLPLIVVNCIILARAEAYASKNGPVDSMLDGLFMGLGFTFALGLLGAVREFIGAGTVWDINVTGGIFPGIAMFTQPAGAFISLGCIIAAVTAIKSFAEKRADAKKHEGGNKA
jgi:electron transport complex protein RnfE